MTVESPRHLRVFVSVVEIAPADPFDDVGRAVEALRGGERNRAALSGGSGVAAHLLLEASRVAPVTALAELRGHAHLDDQPLTADPDDLQPARAVRRALADGRMSASEIGYACAFEVGATDQARALAALERGLGRFAATIELDAASEPFLQCVMAFARTAGSVDGAVGLVIKAGVGSTALAFGRP